MSDPVWYLPLLPAPNGVPWSEYVRTQRNRSRSVSSSTEALESDHARYITRRIAQHARSMATGTRSLPTDSPVPYFQPIERGYMSEGSQEGVYVPPYVNPLEQTINIGGTDYHPNVSETDRVSTYMGQDDYDTLFAARHGRGALDLTMNVTPKGSFIDLPAAVGNIAEDRERKNHLPEEGLQGTSSETAYMEIPDTRVKTVPESTTREAPRVIQRTKEVSREEAIASTRQFFATMDRRNTNITTGSPTGISTEVCERDVTEVPNAPTSIAQPPQSSLMWNQ